MDKKIKVLHVVSSLSGGGVERMLYNYYEKIDKQLITFDFIVHDPNIGILEDQFKKNGSKIFHVVPKKESLIKNIKQIDSIINSGNYDVVHCHQNFMSVTSLWLAKKNNITVRIAHSHGCVTTESFTRKIKEAIFRYFIVKNANYYFACSINSGKWLYGNNWAENNDKNKILYNAIDLDKFRFNVEARNRIRAKYALNEKKVLLHIGRFSEEKNHKFILEIMKELNIRRKNEYIMIFVGDGDLKETILNDTKYNKLDNTLFLGLQKDVRDFLSAADIFILPSKHEGFPVTLVEAQSSGLKVLASENITKETKLTNNIKYIPLNKELWVENIIDTTIEERKDEYSYIQNKKLSIVENVKKYQQFIINSCKKYGV